MNTHFSFPLRSSSFSAFGYNFQLFSFVFFFFIYICFIEKNLLIIIAVCLRFEREKKKKLHTGSKREEQKLEKEKVFYNNIRICIKHVFCRQNGRNKFCNNCVLSAKVCTYAYPALDQTQRISAADSSTKLELSV